MSAVFRPYLMGGAQVVKATERWALYEERLLAPGRAQIIGP